MSRATYFPFLNRGPKANTGPLFGLRGEERNELDETASKPQVARSVFEPNQFHAGNTVPEDKRSIHYATGAIAHTRLWSLPRFFIIYAEPCAHTPHCKMDVMCQLP